MTTTMSRRAWLTGTLGLAAACASRPGGSAAPPAAGARRAIETVTGPIDAAELGVTLMHEHVLVDFIGASEVSRSRYDADAVVATVLPYLRQVRALGCQTIVECTPAYLGRDVQLLQRLSEASGVRILSNTGLLRCGQGQARARVRLHGNRGPAGRALGSRGRARHRRYVDQAGVHEDWRR